MAHPDLSFPAPPPRKRGGLRGFPAFLALLAILAVFPVGLYVLAPWNYYSGGHFHVLPWWSGEGHFHSNASGGDYDLFLTIAPSISQYRRADMNGTAFLCTPSGERVALQLMGDLPSGTYKNLDGVPIRFRFSRLSGSSGITQDYHPHLQFQGTFAQSTLSLVDHGTINQSFAPDGSLYPRDRMGKGLEELRFTVQEKPLSATAPPCRPMAR
jgi:hypothetical protein